MKKTLIAILALLPLVVGCEKDELKNVDDVCSVMNDDIFKAFCIANYDTDSDGKVSMEEAEAVISIQSCKAKDYTGIEYFTNLRSFSSSTVEKLDLTRNTKLTSIDVHSSTITSLDLSNCTEMTTIPEKAFYNCQYLIDFTFPPNITEIKANAFYFVPFKSLTIPDKVEYIRERAFIGPTLQNIVIPASVALIEWEAFWLTTYLESVTVKAIYPPELDEEGDVFMDNDTWNAIGTGPTLYVPEQSIELYENSDWAQYFISIEAL